TVVEGRALEDDAVVLLDLEDGVRGVMMVSQIATGERNHILLRVYGADAALHWSQEDPDRLRMVDSGGTETVLFRGGDVGPHATRATRLPGGHPEGFIEAFANIYSEAAAAILGVDPVTGVTPDFPTVQDGALGVDFICRAVESDRDQAWVKMTAERSTKSSERT
ncbi:MAG TPA: oxidoreductase, partial [Gemmatimonadetes bacterium]|nr:oxidoreductase [Gemmatimonadota bacterium]